MNVEIDGIVYLTDREDNENIVELSDRAWFIAHNKPQNASDYTKTKKMSILYRNTKHLGVTYSQDINNILCKHSYISLQ